MSVPNGNKKFLGMLLLLITLFIFVFFTKPFYSELIATLDAKTQKQDYYNDLRTKLDSLSTKSAQLEKQGEGFEDIQGYLKDFKEDEIITEIYEIASNTTKHGSMKILSLSMTQGVKNELGFNEAQINISARVLNEKVMIEFLNSIIDNPDYTFFIKSFSVPENGKGAFNIQVPITFFYKDIATKTLK